MAYVGNTPADKTLKLEKQQFTTSATTSYTLSHSVSDPQDIALFINNVRQNPNSSYTVSGTTLTLSAATASTDTMYCVFLGRAIGTVGIGAGSVTKDKVDFISDGTGSGVISKGDGSSIDGSIQLNCHVNSHGIKLKSPPHSAGQSYTLTFPSTAPSAGKVLQTDGSGNLSFGGNTPAFFAYKGDGTNQTVSNDTYTKVEFNTESFDTDSNFASNRFTPTTAGKYFIFANIALDASSSNFEYGFVAVYKNGSKLYVTNNQQTNNLANHINIPITIIDDANGSGDYYEIYARIADSSGSPVINAGGTDRRCTFGAYKLIGV